MQGSEHLVTLERKLDLIRDRVVQVASGLHTAVFFFGNPGNSKTFTIRQTLDRMESKYHYHTGHLTPLGLFNLIDDNQDKVIVLDDVAELLNDATAMQYLLAALGESNGSRRVKYRRFDHERAVDFTGGIVYISNILPKDSPLIRALQSRGFSHRHEPTEDELAALMRELVKDGYSDGDFHLDREEAGEVVEAIIAEVKRQEARLDLRLLKKVMADYRLHKSGLSLTPFAGACPFQQSALGRFRGDELNVGHGCQASKKGLSEWPAVDRTVA